jgi:hypothetical protein
MHFKINTGFNTKRGNSILVNKTSLKIPQGQSETVLIEGQTIQWPKGKRKTTKGKTMIYKTLHRKLMFLVLCCDVRYDFHVKPMFDLS